ncbi:MAG: zinc ribbon domain-containing protein, partial [Rhodoferax sp.]|nr:zinc ribbon domain-containing protein [Rhodoferax sp.]
MLRKPIKHCKDCGAAAVYRIPDDGDTKERAVCPVCHSVHYENP